MKHTSKSISKPVLLVILAALLTGLFLLSFCIGRYTVPSGNILMILLTGLGRGLSQRIGLMAEGFEETTPCLFPIDAHWPSVMENVILQIRLPRILLACLVGCCLSAAGAAYQGVFQNPMASPDILGASSGAAFGAALAILTSGSSRTVTLSAFLFSLITVGLVYLIASRAPGKRAMNLVLAGIMVSSLVNAGTSYIKLVADPNNQLPAITYWLIGSLSSARLSDLTYGMFFMALGLVPLLLLRWKINLLTLGDDEARTMGIDSNRLRLTVVLCSTLITAAAISVAGMIGWVGLVVPHMCRRIVGNDYKYLMPASMLLGASFLLAVDDLSRTLLTTEIPIGILTAFIGAPFFLYLMMRKGGH